VVRDKRVVAVGTDQETLLAQAAAQEQCAEQDLVVVVVPRGGWQEIPTNEGTSPLSRASIPSRTTPVDWSVQQVPAGGRTIPVARLRLTLFCRTLSGQRTGPSSVGSILGRHSPSSRTASISTWRGKASASRRRGGANRARWAPSRFGSPPSAGRSCTARWCC
jgi:hypothetical protein